jgi:predicted CXXCH cytochrome family protein
MAVLVLAVSIRSHPGSALLPEGCGSCHVGHGLPDEPMLSLSQEDFCYQCHGPAENRSMMISAGTLAPSESLKDVEREFKKPFHHPVEEAGGHSPVERLPRFDGRAVTHAECVDCHNPHQRVPRTGSKVDAVSGYSLSGQYLEQANQEYEVCLKCHTDVIGGPNTDTDIRREFATSARSMHPVTRPAIGKRQPSVKSLGTGSATMQCSDCHRSNDPDSPRGPHGSDYPFLLSGNYVTAGEVDESPLAFEFCYSCHERSSILNNESFPLHQEHIVGNVLKGVPGTSCFTCHASHGSEDEPFLIRFNPEVVTGTGVGKRLDYLSYGNRTGACFLTCHGHDHDPAEY